MNQYESSRPTLSDYVKLLFKTLQNSKLMKKALHNASWTVFLMKNGYELSSYQSNIEYFAILSDDENKEVIMDLVELGLDLGYHYNFETTKKLYEDYGEQALELCRNPPFRNGRFSFDVFNYYRTVEKIGYEKVKELRNDNGWSVGDMLDLLELKKELGVDFERAEQYLKEYVSDKSTYSSLGKIPVFKIEVVYQYVNELREIHSLESKEKSGRIRFFGKVTGVGFRSNTSLMAKAFGFSVWKPENYGNTVIAKYTSKRELLDFFIKYLKEESRYKTNSISHKLLV